MAVEQKISKDRQGMELICPQCDARYQIPDGSIGAAGRQVSCMSCGHAWHAYPPLMLDTQAETAELQAPAEPPASGGGGLLSSDWDTEPPAGGPVTPERGAEASDGGGGLLASDYERDPPPYLRQTHGPADEPSGPVMHGGPLGGQTGGQRLKLHDSNDAGGARPAPPPRTETPDQPAATSAAASHQI